MTKRKGKAESAAETDAAGDKRESEEVLSLRRRLANEYVDFVAQSDAPYFQNVANLPDCGLGHITVERAGMLLALDWLGAEGWGNDFFSTERQDAAKAEAAKWTKLLMASIEKHKTLTPSRAVRDRDGNLVSHWTYISLEDFRTWAVEYNFHLGDLRAMQAYFFGEFRLRRAVERIVAMVQTLRWRDAPEDSIEKLLDLAIESSPEALAAAFAKNTGGETEREDAKRNRLKIIVALLDMAGLGKTKHTKAATSIEAKLTELGIPISKAASKGGDSSRTIGDVIKEARALKPESS